MGRLFFIAGCARSGTTLLLELMPSFKGMHALTDAEWHFSDFSKINSSDGHVLLKRRIDSHHSLPDIPSDIDLIYAVRHPCDTLTSHHPDFPNRKFYVSEKRWRDEYASLKELRVKQPARTITYVRYCDLVTSPDEVQKHLATSLGLRNPLSISKSGTQFSTSSIKKYENDPKLQRYLWLLPHGLRQEIKEFCNEFGYELPPGYVQSPSLIGDGIRTFLVPIKARNWPVAIAPDDTRTLKQLRQAQRSLSRLLRRPNREGTGAHRRKIADPAPHSRVPWIRRVLMRAKEDQHPPRTFPVAIPIQVEPRSIFLPAYRDRFDFAECIPAHHRSA